MYPAFPRNVTASTRQNGTYSDGHTVYRWIHYDLQEYTVSRRVSLEFNVALLYSIAFVRVTKMVSFYWIYILSIEPMYGAKRVCKALAHIIMSLHIQYPLETKVTEATHYNNNTINSMYWTVKPKTLCATLNAWIH